MYITYVHIYTNTYIYILYIFYMYYTHMWGVGNMYVYKKALDTYKKAVTMIPSGTKSNMGD